MGMHRGRQLCSGCQLRGDGRVGFERGGGCSSGLVQRAVHAGAVLLLGFDFVAQGPHVQLQVPAFKPQCLLMLSV